MFLNYTKDDVCKTALELCKLFIANGADVNAEDKWKGNVLHFAVRQCFSFQDCKSNKDKEAHHLFVENMVQLLLKHGASFRSSSRKHAIHCVNTERQAEWLIAQDPTALDETGNWTLLDHAIHLSGGTAEGDKMINVFIKRGAKTKLSLLELARYKSCRFFVIESLLEVYPEYGVDTRNMTDETLLIQYGSDLNTVKKLLKLGADATAVDRRGNTALVTAAKKKDVAAVHLLLKSGADPSKFSAPHTCIIVIICKAFTMKRCKVQMYLDLLKHVLEMPQMKIDQSSTSLSTAYALILDNLLDSQHWEVINNRLADILNCILTPNVKNMQILPQKNEDITVFNYKFKMPMFNILTYALYTFVMKNSRRIGDEYVLLKLLYILRDCGVSFQTEEDFISPLSVLLLHDSVKFDDLVYDKVMDQGINMISSTLQMKHEDEILQDLYQTLQIPDAVFLAFINKKIEFLLTLVQHYWGPPLSLLIFTNNFTTLELAECFSTLMMKYGGIPHGTMMFQQFKKQINRQELYLHTEEEVQRHLTQYQDCLSKYPNFLIIVVIIL
jgi:ankyrin repeat protein